MGKARSVGIALSAWAVLGLATASPALAEAPMDLPASTRIEDTTGVLNRGELQSAIDRLKQEHNINLYVVTIDSFENPSNSEAWARELMSMNNMGTNDVVLAIATEERAARFISGGGELNQQQGDKIYTNRILPELQNSDYEAASLAAAEGIDSELSGGGISGVLTGVGTLGGIALVAGGGAWLLGRNRKKGGSPATGAPRGAGRPAPAAPAPSIEQLRTEAGALLVSTDDAIAHSEQEVEFARLQYGEAEVAPFAVAIDEAKQHMQRSFQLQKQLDDDIPDTEADQRSWLTEIIGRCRDAQQALKNQEENFNRLRQLEQNAPAVLETLKTRDADLDSLFASARQSLGRMQATYAPGAFESVEDNLDQAQGHREFVREAVETASAQLDTNRSEAILEIRAGEEAVGQAKGLLESVLKTEDELRRAGESLESALLLARRDVAQAQELAKHQASGELAGAAAGVSAVLDRIEAESRQPKNDPLALSKQLTEVRSELDSALGNMREVHEQERSARATLAHALVSAQAQVSSASEYVWARRGGVRAEARTKLREAERHLTEAQNLQQRDPVAALAHANDATRLADEAKRIARDDVDRFNQDHFGGYGRRGRSDNSALLGGILLGTLLGGNNSGFGGGFGGGGHFGGGGSFGGGFGGGGGGGFSSGGTF